MSNKQLERIRDESLAARVKRAIGGVPTLQLAIREPDAYVVSKRTASMLAVARVFGDVPSKGGR